SIGLERLRWEADFLMTKQVFYDPKKKRWARLRVLLNVAGVVLTRLILFFVITTLRPVRIEQILMPAQQRHLKTLKDGGHRRRPKGQGAHRKTQAPASEVQLNVDEGIRAAYYVTWDAASFVSLQEYYPQVDILFPEWLHVLTPDGTLQGLDSDNQL